MWYSDQTPPFYSKGQFCLSQILRNISPVLLLLMSEELSRHTSNEPSTLEKPKLYFCPPLHTDLKISNLAISHTLKPCIAEAYNIFKVHIPTRITGRLVRSATTNAAFARHATSKEICKAATWSPVSTFIRHYKINT